MTYEVFNQRYRDYLEREEESSSYRIVPVRPPVPVYRGEPITVTEAFGDRTPPHVLAGKALQNVVEMVDYENVLIDPVSYTFYSVTPVPRSVRGGRVKPTVDALAPLVEVQPEVRVAATRSFQNYYHWLIETMPRTMRVHFECDGAQALTHVHRAPFHRDYQSFLPIELNLRHVATPMFVERATTTTLTTNFEPDGRLSRHALPSEDILTYPRLVQEALIDRPRRVFISRRDANTRVLNDEAALCAELEQRGFDCPVMGELTLFEQASLCANAEIIIAPHGAGIANILFRQGPCKMVEIVPLERWPEKNLVCYYNLSQVCGFEHYLYDAGFPDQRTRLLSQNWSVDHREFLAFIDTLL